ncbi:MAG: hypothetical protein GXY83_29330 [Rhodopirellula sp.]|nr:hypothetical protein [Rhodopirellula sp.]
MIQPIRIAFVVSLIITSLCHADSRTWTDTSGRFQVEAEFVGVEDGAVRLRKADGAEIAVPIEKLSAPDQEHVRTILQKRETHNAGEKMDTQDLDRDQPGEASTIGSRLWTDRVTRQQVEASFVELLEDCVLVERPDGRRARIPLDRLSEADQQYVWEIAWEGQEAVKPDGASDGQGQGTSTELTTPGGATAEGAIVDADDASPARIPDGRRYSLLDLCGAVMQRNLMDSLPSWFEWPRLGFTIGVWLGCAVATSLIAMLFGRSVIGWFVVGLVLPGIGQFPLLAKGDATLPPHPRTRPIFALRLAVIVTSLSGLAMLGYFVWSLDDFTTVALYDRLSSIHLAFLFGLPGLLVLNWVLAKTLGSLLSPPIGSGNFMAAIIPFIGSLLFAALCRSKRGSTPWAMAFQASENSDDDQINDMKAAGHLDRAAQVFWGERLGKAGQVSSELLPLAIEGIAKTLVKLPANYQSTQLRPQLNIGKKLTLILVVAPGDVLKNAGQGPLSGPNAELILQLANLNAQPQAVQPQPALRPSPPTPIQPKPTPPQPRPSPGPTPLTPVKHAGGAANPSGKRSIESLIMTVTQPASLARHDDELRELVERKAEAGGPVFDAFLAFVTRRHPNAVNRHNTGFNYEGCRTLVSLLVQMKFQRAVTQLRQAAAELARSNTWEDVKLAEQCREGADRILGIHRDPTAAWANGPVIDRKDPLGQILLVTDNLRTIVCDRKQTEQHLQWASQMVKTLPELEVGLFGRCETAEDAKAWVWRHLGAVVWCLHHKKPDAPFFQGRPCPEAEFCLEQALKLVKKREFRSQMEEAYRNLTGRAWE